MSSRETETDAQRAFRKLQAAVSEFQETLADLMQSQKAFRYRLEVIGDKGRISEIQLQPLKIDRCHED